MSLSTLSTVSVQNLLIPFITQVQDLEDAMVDQMWYSRLDVAEGVTLDTLGEVAGQARITGQSDTDYRAAIKLRCILNQASGTADDLYAALEIMGAPTYMAVVDCGLAAVSIFTNTTHVFTPSERQQTRRIAAAGVRVNIMQQDAEPFVFKEVGAADPTYGLGMDNTVGAGTMGTLAELLP
jgi:hypothetical protein